MSMRPVVIVWKVLPVGAPEEGGGGGGEEGDWGKRLKEFHEELVRGCEEECVSLQGGEKWEGDACYGAGYADLVVFGHAFQDGHAGHVLPLREAFKGQREMWGYVSPPSHSDPSPGESVIE